MSLWVLFWTVMAVVFACLCWSFKSLVDQALAQSREVEGIAHRLLAQNEKLLAEWRGLFHHILQRPHLSREDVLFLQGSLQRLDDAAEADSREEAIDEPRVA